MGDVLKSCEVCSKANGKTCGSCRKVSYCSVNCQKKDRKRHKYDCYPMEREPNVYNRAYQVNFFATRDIKQGEIVFKETPLCAGPISPGKMIGPRVMRSGSKEVCLGCCTILKGDTCCTDCGWPLCGPACPKIHLHKVAECGIFSVRQILPRPNMPNSIKYGVVRYLRTLLLRTEDPFKWEELLKLFPYCDPNDITDRNLNDFEKEFIVHFIQSTCNMTGFDKETINKIVTIDNCLGIDCMTLTSEPEFGIKYVGRLVNTIQHSCIPNLQSNGLMINYIKTDTKNMGITRTVKVIAVVDIKKGSKVTITGSEDAEKGWEEEATLKRRKRISDFAGYWCKCPRCTDPTELGTYYSAIKCQNCPSGYILSEDPLVLKARWKCNNCSYELSDPEKVFEMGETEIAPLISNAIKAGFDGFQALIEDFTDEKRLLLSQLNEMVKKYEDWVHPNFFGSYKLKSLILNGLFSMVIKMPWTSDVQVQQERRRKLEEIECLAQYCYKITNILFPGLTLIRANHLFFVTMSKWMNVEDVVIPGGRIMDIKARVEEAMDLYRELRGLVSVFEDTGINILYMRHVNFMKKVVTDSVKAHRLMSRRILPILNAN